MVAERCSKQLSGLWPGQLAPKMLINSDGVRSYRLSAFEDDEHLRIN